MEPRARVGRNRGQQNFSDQELGAMLFSHGDVENPLPSTIKVLDEMTTDFIVGLCFEADRAAEIAGRQKVKLDDIKFACRKDPTYLGKIEEIMEKKSEIDKARKALDVNDDKITKSNLKALAGGDAAKEEELGEADDDADAGKSTGTGAGK